MNDLQLNQLFTYHLIIEEGEDEKDISNMLYQIQLLELFDLKNLDVDFDKLNEKMDTIYLQLKDETLILELLDVHPYKDSMTHELMFRTLFSYDYLYLFHKYLYNYFNKQNITSDSNFYIELKNKLMSK
jgi:hypothetical protein